MGKIISINKPVGITSYDVIRQLKKKYPGEKIGHAGTLDPLADGVLICLVGKDATKRQSEFMNITKEYEFTVLHGIDTDTYDVLGLITDSKQYDEDKIEKEIKSNVDKYQGELEQPVPPFSAVKIKGKPLYRWYLDGKINEVEIPVKTISVDEIELLGTEIISSEDLKTRTIDLINTVKSGFRQNIVLEKWEEYFKSSRNNQYVIGKYRAKVSKGTYVRAIAHQMGKDLGVGACTITITRTQVGEFNIKDSIKIDNCV